MYKLRSKNSLGAKITTLIVVGLFFLNTISWALPQNKPASVRKETLQVQSIFKPILDVTGRGLTAQIQMELATILAMSMGKESAPFQDINAALDHAYGGDSDRENERLLNLTGDPRQEDEEKVIDIEIFHGPGEGKTFRITSSAESMDQILEDSDKIKIEEEFNEISEEHVKDVVTQTKDILGKSGALGRKKKPDTPGGNIGKKAHVEKINKGDTTEAFVRDSKGREHMLKLKKKWSFSDRLRRIVIQDRDHQGIVDSLVGLIEKEDPEMYVYGTLIEDLFGFARPEDKTMAVYTALKDVPEALLHEIGEYLAATGRIKLEFKGTLARGLKRVGLYERVKYKKWLKGKIIIRDDRGRKMHSLPVSGMALSIALKDPKSAHYLLRAVQREIFGGHDVGMTLNIQEEQKGRETKEKLCEAALHNPDLGIVNAPDFMEKKARKMGRETLYAVSVGPREIPMRDLSADDIDKVVGYPRTIVLNGRAIEKEFKDPSLRFRFIMRLLFQENARWVVSVSPRKQELFDMMGMDYVRAMRDYADTFLGPGIDAICGVIAYRLTLQAFEDDIGEFPELLTDGEDGMIEELEKFVNDEKLEKFWQKVDAWGFMKKAMRMTSEQFIQINDEVANPEESGGAKRVDIRRQWNAKQLGKDPTDEDTQEVEIVREDPIDEYTQEPEAVLEMPTKEDTQVTFGGFDEDIDAQTMGPKDELIGEETAAKRDLLMDLYESANMSRIHTGLEVYDPEEAEDMVSEIKAMKKELETIGEVDFLKLSDRERNEAIEIYAVLLKYNPTFRISGKTLEHLIAAEKKTRGDAAYYVEIAIRYAVANDPSLLEKAVKALEENRFNRLQLYYTLLLKLLERQSDEAIRDVLTTVIGPRPEFYDDYIIEYILVPLALSRPAIFTDDMLEKLKSRYAHKYNENGVNRFKLFLFFALMGRNEKGREDELSRLFPAHEKIRKILGREGARVLIVHNVRDGFGDESLRTNVLMQALLDYNPTLEVVLLTNRQYRAPPARVTIIELPEARIGMAGSMEEIENLRKKLEQDHYDMVVAFKRHAYNGNVFSSREFWPPGTINRFIRSFEKKADIYIEGEGYRYSHVGVVGVEDEHLRRSIQEMTPTAGLALFTRMGNVYNFNHELCAVLGLPFRRGTEKSDESVLLGNRDDKHANEWWEREVADRNTDNRKVIAVMGEGGNYPAKGLSIDQYGILLRRLTEKYHVVILDAHRWAGMERTKERLKEWRVAEAHVSILPTPEAFRADCPFLNTSVIDKSDAVIAVEGGLLHFAYALGKPFIALRAPLSGNFDTWISQARDPERQIILEDALERYLDPETGQQDIISLVGKAMKVFSRQENEPGTISLEAITEAVADRLTELNEQVLDTYRFDSNALFHRRCISGSLTGKDLESDIDWYGGTDCTGLVLAMQKMAYKAITEGKLLADICPGETVDIKVSTPLKKGEPWYEIIVKIKGREYRIKNYVAGFVARDQMLTREEREDIKFTHFALATKVKSPEGEAAIIMNDPGLFLTKSMTAAKKIKMRKSLYYVKMVDSNEVEQAIDGGEGLAWMKSSEEGRRFADELKENAFSFIMEAESGKTTRKHLFMDRPVRMEEIDNFLSVFTRSLLFTSQRIYRRGAEGSSIASASIVLSEEEDENLLSEAEDEEEMLFGFSPSPVTVNLFYLGEGGERKRATLPLDDLKVIRDEIEAKDASSYSETTKAFLIAGRQLGLVEEGQMGEDAGKSQLFIRVRALLDKDKRKTFMEEVRTQHYVSTMKNIRRQLKEADDNAACVDHAKELAKKLESKDHTARVVMGLVGQAAWSLPHFWVETDNHILDPYPEGLGKAKSCAEPFMRDGVVVINKKLRGKSTVYKEGTEVSAKAWELFSVADVRAQVYDKKGMPAATALLYEKFKASEWPIKEKIKEQILNAYKNDKVFNKIAAAALGREKERIAADTVEVSYVGYMGEDKERHRIYITLDSGEVAEADLIVYCMNHQDSFEDETEALELLGGKNAPKLFGRWRNVKQDVGDGEELDRNGYMFYATKVVRGQSLDAYERSVKNLPEKEEEKEKVFTLASMKYAEVQKDITGTVRKIEISGRDAVVGFLPDGEPKVTVIKTEGAVPIYTRRMKNIRKQLAESDKEEKCMSHARELVKDLRKDGVPADVFIADTTVGGKALFHFWVETEDYVLDPFPEGLGDLAHHADPHKKGDVMIMKKEDKQKNPVYREGEPAFMSKWGYVLDGLERPDTQSVKTRMLRRSYDTPVKGPQIDKKIPYRDFTDVEKDARKIGSIIEKTDSRSQRVQRETSGYLSRVIDEMKNKGKMTPVDIVIDLSLISKYDLEENMETWAYLILSCAALDNVNFIFEVPNPAGTGESPDELAQDLSKAPKAEEALKILKDRIKKKSALIGGQAINSIMNKRINRNRRDGALEVPLISTGWLRWMKKRRIRLNENQYPVALEGLTNMQDNEVVLRNFEAALMIGLAKTALAIAKERDRKTSRPEELPALRKELLTRLQELYEVFRPEIKLTEDTLDSMVSPHTRVRLNLAINLALPPITRMYYEKLRDFHKSIQLFLQAA